MDAQRWRQVLDVSVIPAGSRSLRGSLEITANMTDPRCPHGKYHDCDRCRQIRHAPATSGGTSYTDGAPALDVLREVRVCALAWKPEVRILGNVRAQDVARAVTEVTNSLLDSTDDALRLHRDKMDLWELVHYPPSAEEISETLELFRAEMHKRMDTNHPSASPGHESMTIALRAVFSKRSEKAKLRATPAVRDDE